MSHYKTRPSFVEAFRLSTVNRDAIKKWIWAKGGTAGDLAAEAQKVWPGGLAVGGQGMADIGEWIVFSEPRTFSVLRHDEFTKQYEPATPQESTP